MRIDVRNKHVLVIGGSGAIGSAIAAAFVAEGASVAIAGTRPEKTERVAAEIETKDGPVIPLIVDVCSRDSLDAAALQLHDQWPQLDVLINSAGGNIKEATVAPDGEFFEISDTAFLKVLDLNLLGTAVRPIQAFGKMMLQGEGDRSIVNISSVASSLPLTRVGGYSAAKAAVDSMTRWLAVEFAKKYESRIRVNAVAPGFVLTDQNRYLLYDQESGELTDRGRTALEQVPQRRFGEPEELGGVCLWLASDAARFVTGTVIPVDGGFTAFGGV